MLFQVGNLWVKVVGSDDELVRLWNALSWENPRARFTNAYRSGSWDGKVRFFHYALKRFPAGLWFWKGEELKRLFPELVVQDVRVKPKVEFNGNFTLDLRDYQKEAVRRVIEGERGILWMPTGSGKTEIAIEVASHIEGRKLFLVHRRDLLHQTYERFKKYGYDAGRYGGGYRELDAEVIVSTIQTFRNAPKELYSGWSVVFFDETHLVPANEFFKTAMKIDAYYRIGMSGTPLGRDDERNIHLFCATGPILYRVKVDVLAQEGFLVVPRVIFHRYHDLQPLVVGDWKEEYDQLIVKNYARNLLVCRLAVNSPKPCLIFVKILKHGRILQDIFRTRFNIDVPFVFGNTLQEVRNEFRRLMSKGKVDILIASVIFEEGIDIPNLRTIVVASGGKSGIKTIQRVGRGMRPYEGKDEVIVHDFIDTGKYSSRHTKIRKKLYLQEGYRVAEE